METKRIYTYTITLVATCVFIVSSCSEEEQIRPTEPTPVALNLSRAEGSGGGLYALMLWHAQPGESDALTGLGQALAKNTSFWTYSLSKQTGETPQAGEVDYYQYKGENDYAVTNNGAPIYYQRYNVPTFALGYYPADSLQLSEDKKTLTLLTPTQTTLEEIKACKGFITLPGLVDVCSTEIETGTEGVPFTSRGENELQYKHTQVKLNFKFKRTENLNGRVAQIWVTIPDKYLADKWSLQGVEGYKPEDAEKNDSPNGDLIFASEEDWYGGKPNVPYDLYFSSSKNKDYVITENPNCYVLPEEGLFESGTDGKQYLNIKLDAVIVSIDFPNRRLNTTAKIPLTKEDGTYWTEKVKAGDAFTIEIIFDQKQLMLLAEKTKWEPGTKIHIPLNPIENTETE